MAASSNSPSSSSSDSPFSLSPASQSLISQLTPFRFHTPHSTEFLEPYLPLPSSTLPFPLILTPPRPSDTPRKLSVLNDPVVTKELTGPPFPYLEEHEVGWSEGKWKDTKEVFEGWEKTIMTHQENKRESEVALEKPRMGLPFQCIRKEDGEWIGEIGVIRHAFLAVEDTEEREKLQNENNAREVGDKELVWCFGYYLAPEYHGKGIMTSVLTSLIENYFVPYLDAHIIRASAFSDNPASIRVQEKSGLVRTGEKYLVQITEVKGGGKREESVLEWRRNV